MKIAGNIGRQMVKKEDVPKLVHFIAVVGGWKKLKEPKMSNELKCLLCGEQSCFTPLVEPTQGDERVWLCGNLSCGLYNKANMPQATTIEPTQKRAVLWQIWCQINEVGDVNHDVTFEGIEQSAGKIEYLKKFVVNPSGIILMEGEPGTGKTFCSLATCEYLTRTETSVIFMTQKQMMDKWLATFKEEKPSNFVNKVKECTLLVIDDFGTSEPSPGFMTFFMDVINTRLQWKKRGTIVTTNLNAEKFNQYCGEALADRILTGQKFIFEGNTRRIKQPL
jgi:IstB-like ATP binding protein